MRPTRFEVMRELRRLFGNREETEHLIDWLQDAWHTYDVLVERVGQESATQMIHAVETASDAPRPHDLPFYHDAHEQVYQCLLN